MATPGDDRGGRARAAAIVLAAGSSSRMGRSKQLLEIAGCSLVRHVVEVARAASLSPVVVVVGAEGQAIRAEIADLDVSAVENASWREGIASSLQCGLRALPGTAELALVLLCDQPAVSASLLQAMLQAQRQTGKEIVACRYAGALGAPALFARSRFPELLALAGDVGARTLLRRAGDEAAIVDFPEGAFDLDTPEDWRRWQGRAGASGGSSGRP